MAYDEQLAERVRELLDDRADLRTARQLQTGVARGVSYSSGLPAK